MKTHQDIVIGVVILAFCAFFFALSLHLEAGAALMPQILLVVMAILGLLIIAGGVKKTKATTAENPVKPLLTVESLKVPFVGFCIVSLYIAAFELIGFYAATALFLVGMMRWLKQKDWMPILVTSGIFLAITYFFLVKQLNVSIPALGSLGRMYLKI